MSTLLLVDCVYPKTADNYVLQRIIIFVSLAKKNLLYDQILQWDHKMTEYCIPVRCHPNQLRPVDRGWLGGILY